MKNTHRNTFDRRRFIKLMGGGAAALGSASCLPHVSGDWNTCQESGAPLDLDLPSPRVIEVSSQRVINEESMKMDATVVADMFRAGLLALCQQQNLRDAWRQVMPGRQAQETISLKLNALNPDVPTSPELVMAVCASLQTDFEVPSQEMFVWDRTVRELTDAGIVPDLLGVACRGTYNSARDQQGPGYEEASVCLSGRKIHLANLLTQETSHLLNLAVLKNHGASGFTGCLKNQYGSFANPGDFHSGCEQHIARLNTMPQIASVSRLFVLDALFAVCRGDTDRPKDCIPKRLLFSFDPVAIDQRGLEIRDEMRASFGVDPGAPAGYLAQAASLGLGTTDYQLEKIEI